MWMLKWVLSVPRKRGLMVDRQLAPLKRVNGVWFNGKHSYRDYGMQLTARPTISDPEPRLILIDIPGADGILDATESISGSVVRYKNRELQFRFISEVPAEKQVEFVSRIMNDLHGQTVQVELDEDAGWLWSGRATVKSEPFDKWRVIIEIDVDAYPYKQSKKTKNLTFSVASSGSTALFLLEFEEIEISENIAKYKVMPDNQDLSIYIGIKFKLSEKVSYLGYEFVDYAGNNETGVYYDGGALFDEFTVYIDPEQTYLVDWEQISEIVLEDGIISKIYGISSGQIFHIENGKMQTIPYVSLNSDINKITIVKNGKEIKFTDIGGSNPNFWLDQFENEVFAKNPVITGNNPTITFSFAEGWL